MLKAELKTLVTRNENSSHPQLHDKSGESHYIVEDILVELQFDSALVNNGDKAIGPEMSNEIENASFTR